MEGCSASFRYTIVATLSTRPAAHRDGEGGALRGVGHDVGPLGGALVAGEDVGVVGGELRELMEEGEHPAAVRNRRYERQDIARALS